MTRLYKMSQCQYLQQVGKHRYQAFVRWHPDLLSRVITLNLTQISITIDKLECHQRSTLDERRQPSAPIRSMPRRQHRARLTRRTKSVLSPRIGGRKFVTFLLRYHQGFIIDYEGPMKLSMPLSMIDWRLNFAGVVKNCYIVSANPIASYALIVKWWAVWNASILRHMVSATKTKILVLLDLEWSMMNFVFWGMSLVCSYQKSSKNRKHTKQ